LLADHNMCHATTLLCLLLCNCLDRKLHSFPTRRSSDLKTGKNRPCHEIRRKDRGVPSRNHRRGKVHGYDGVYRQYQWCGNTGKEDRKSTRLNSSHVKISYAVFCLKKNKKQYSSDKSEHE